MSTPMQQQYDKLKKKHEDCILLFRLGDFYECFDNDAKIISKVLGIVLTKRGKGANSRPMAGIPHHALDNYLHKLVDAGYKAAIVEQLEEPQKGKQIVDRDVVKIVSAGTITSEKSLSENKNNYIACISSISTKKLTTWGLAVCELTTGEFYLSEYYSKSSDEIAEILAEVRRIYPAEILISKENSQIFSAKGGSATGGKGKLENIRIQEVEDYDFGYPDNKKRLQNHFKVKTLKGFGIDKYKAGICAAGVILDYLQETQKASLNHINKISYRNSSKYMLLDESTIRNLELVVPLRGNESVTLLSILDKCQTPMGKRKLYNWLLRPLKHVSDIKERLDSTEELFKDSVKLGNIREVLDNIYDVERILGKIGTESVNARDLLALKDSLTNINSLSKYLKIFKSNILKSVYKTLNKQSSIEQVTKLIDTSINEDPPITITEGGMIKERYSRELDDIQKGAKEGKEWLKTLEQEEREKTNIQSLKVKFNKVFGYYIEVSKSNLDRVPENYIRKQTLVNAERFITPELKEKEDLILHSQERSMELEYKLFVEIREKITTHIKKLQEIAEAIAVLDCLANFAQIARLNDYMKPELLDNGKAVLEIKEGRHPVVEQIQEEAFISNDTELNCKDRQIAIITGPNMAGKSTYIRQVALITLMAQMGSFVPAKSMRFKPVDRIFTRVGASDNLSAGESTFLVEMNETANILNNATSDSLIILDEVGRGTSTYDGVAIAWAVAEYIHEHIGAKTLFATHYHELIDLKKYLKRVVNLNVTVEESKGKVIFLRKIEEGGTDKSYGVHVAEMSGIPQDVIKKAKEILMSLEQEGMFEVKRVENELTANEANETNKAKAVSPQIQLLTKLPENPVVKELKKLDVNKMTPLEALEKLDELVQKTNK